MTPANDLLEPAMEDGQSHTQTDLTIELTVVRVNGLKRAPILPPHSFVTLAIGNETFTTKVSGRELQPVWNETFKFTRRSSENLAINLKLYQLSRIKGNVLLEQIEGCVLDLGTEEEQTKTFSAASSTSSATITFRVKCSLPSRRSRCGIFALIFGINQYKCPTFGTLDGSVNDAKSVHDFLTRRLHVPDSHIVFLSNESATRDAILSSFRTHLIHNDKIQKDDAIVIFFAGHGSRLDAPKGWPDGKVESLCPHDQGTRDSHGNLIHGIPDRSINAMLNELATTKGNNIIVIIDSCHSGGATRDPQLGKARSTMSLPIPEDLDSDIWKKVSSPVIKRAGFQNKDLSSHVLLAACRPEETAFESRSAKEPCGAFTNVLVKHLHQAVLERVTYSNLISRLPDLVNQHPQCEGTHKNRFLFDMTSDAGDSGTFWLTPLKDGTFGVNVGSLRGIVADTEFAVQDQSGHPLGILITKSVTVLASVLMRRPGDDKFIVPAGARAMVLDWKLVLKVFIASELVFGLLGPKQDIFLPQADTEIVKRKFIQVDSRSKADVALRQDPRGDLHIERLDSLIPKYASHTVRVNPPYKLDCLLDGVAHFNFYLGVDHDIGPYPVADPLEQKVTLELYRLVESGWSYKPDEKVGNLLTNYQATVADDGTMYGIAIVNRSGHNIYPYLFYFDPSDYSIEPWYLPTSDHVSLPPPSLRNQSTLIVGADNGDPIQFTLTDKEQSDTGFIKLFVSNRYMDMGWMAQQPLLACSPRGGKTKAPDTKYHSWIAAVTVSKF